MTTKTCAICASESELVSALNVLRADRHLFRCRKCGFVFFSNVDWLQVAYQQSYTQADTKWLGRSLWGARFIDTVCKTFFPFKATENIEIFEFGAGYGVSSQFLSDLGYSVSAYDRYAQIKHFDGFISSSEKVSADVSFALEVAEHIPAESLDELKHLLKSSPIALISTEVPPVQNTDLLNWEYLGLHHGQHVSFFSMNSLKHLSKQIGKRLITDGRWLHLFVDHNFFPTPMWYLKARARFRFCSNPWKV